MGAKKVNKEKCGEEPGGMTGLKDPKRAIPGQPPSEKSAVGHENLPGGLLGSNVGPTSVSGSSIFCGL